MIWIYIGLGVLGLMGAYWLISYLLVGTFHKLIINTHDNVPCKRYKRSSCWNWNNTPEAERYETFDVERRWRMIVKCAGQNAHNVSKRWIFSLPRLLMESRSLGYTTNVLITREQLLKAEAEAKRLEEKQKADSMEIESIVAELRSEGLNTLTLDKFDVLLSEPTK